MAWITTKDGRHVNTDWFDKDKQIADNKKEANERNNKEKDNSTGTGSPSYKSANAYAKRNMDSEKYSFNETVLDAAYTYYLNKDEVKALTQSLLKYAEKHHLYANEMHDRVNGGRYTFERYWEKNGKRILDDID